MRSQADSSLRSSGSDVLDSARLSASRASKTDSLSTLRSTTTSSRLSRSTNAVSPEATSSATRRSGDLGIPGATRLPTRRLSQQDGTLQDRSLPQRLGSNVLAAVSASGTADGKGLIPSVSSTQTFDGDRIIPSAAVVGERTTVETYSHRRKSFGYYPHHHRHHHYGFRLGVYYGYPYCCSISVGYPYVGYYSIYGYPYLAGYGCGFYGGFYVRFGPARLSYYSVCSGLGVHAYSYHHHHLYDCPVHGIHYYHKRDCPVCYPYGLGGTTGGYYADGSLERAEAAEGEGSEAQISLDSLKPEAEESLAAVDDPLSTLTPAKQSFALGFLAFENGDYDEAAEFFFNASIEDSNSIVPQLFLFVSLVAIGEYDYASSYLRSAIDKSNGRLIQYRFNVKKLYGEDRQSDFEAHRKLLFERAQLYPSDPDTLLLNGFLALNVEDFQQAGISALGLRDVAEAPSDRRLGEKLLDEVEVRKGLRSEESRDGGSSALKSFLENPTAESIDTLPIR